MMRALYDGIFRSCHTWGIGERETRASTSTWFLMLAQVDSPVNSIGANGNVVQYARNPFLGMWADPIARKPLSNGYGFGNISHAENRPRRVNALVYEWVVIPLWSSKL